MMSSSHTFNPPEHTDHGGELSQLDTILQNIELESKPDSQLSEKEQQQIAALERNIRDKESRIQRIQEDLDHSDGDAKTLHRQFRQNRDNFESLRKDTEVLSSHIDTMETNLKQCVAKYELIREKRIGELKQYQARWAGYHRKYESTPVAQRWKGCHDKVEVGLQSLVDQADGVHGLTKSIEQFQEKLAAASVDRNAWKSFIIEIAEVRVATLTLPEVAEKTGTRIKELHSELDAAQQRKKEAEDRQKAACLAREKIESTRVDNAVTTTLHAQSHAITPVTQSQPRVAPGLVMPVLQRPMPQLVIPHTPRQRMDAMPTTPRTPRQGQEPAPTPQSFIQIPQRQRTIETLVSTATGPSIAKSVSTPPPQPAQWPPVVADTQEPMQRQQLPTGVQLSGAQNEEPVYERMEVDQGVPGYEPLLSSPAPDTPRSNPKTPTGEEVMTGGGGEEELSASQVREKILNLSKSPAFSFARRPMYMADETTSASTNREEQPSSFMNFFGQMDEASSGPPSAMNMFASPVHSEGSDGNIMSMFGGGSSQEEPAAPQEQSSGFSFNFTPAADSGRSSFSLF